MLDLIQLTQLTSVAPSAAVLDVHGRVNAGGPTYPPAEKVAKRLNTSVDDFHKNIKPQIIKDFIKELKMINTKNPDIGWG